MAGDMEWYDTDIIKISWTIIEYAWDTTNCSHEYLLDIPMIFSSFPIQTDPLGYLMNLLLDGSMESHEFPIQQWNIHGIFMWIPKMIPKYPINIPMILASHSDYVFFQSHEYVPFFLFIDIPSLSHIINTWKSQYYRICFHYNQIPATFPEPSPATGA